MGTSPKIVASVVMRIGRSRSVPPARPLPERQAIPRRRYWCNRQEDRVYDHDPANMITRYTPED